jgi:hypothetical protein
VKLLSAVFYKLAKVVVLLTCTGVVNGTNAQPAVLHEVSHASLSSQDKRWDSTSNHEQAFVVYMRYKPSICS